MNSCLERSRQTGRKFLKHGGGIGAARSERPFPALGDILAKIGPLPTFDLCHQCSAAARQTGLSLRARLSPATAKLSH